MLNHDRCAVVHGEALVTIRSLFTDKSVDTIITDPPYSEHAHANLGKERRNDGHQERDALQFPPLTLTHIEVLAREFVRIARGWIVIFSDFYLSAEWGRAVERAGGKWIRTGHWVKTNPMPQMTGDRPSVGAEDIVICHAVGKHMEWGGKGHAAIWRGPRDINAEHPNQKPAWLMQSLVGLFAPAGGLVLDPFFGNGSTAYGALYPNRIMSEVPAETKCKKCAAKQMEQWQPPLPQGVRVVGIEGDEKWATSSIARISPLLDTLSPA